MTLVTDVLKRAARGCSVAEPTSWIGALDEAQTEIRDDFLPETVDDVLERIEVPQPLAKTTTLTGDGTEDYALPADFKRLQRDAWAVYERTSTRRPCHPVTSDGQWEYMKELGSAGAYKFFRIRGWPGNYEMDLYRAPATGDVIVVNYVSTLWIDNAGTKKSAFTDDADVTLIPRRIVEAGIVWRFRDRKGLPYADKMAEYEMLLNRWGNESRVRRVLDMGQEPHARSIFDIPVPDVIPAS